MGGLLIMLSCISASAQTLKEALITMKQEHGEFERLHVVMMIEAFETSSSQTPVYKQRAEVKRDNDLYYYSLGDTEMLLNKGLLVMVDHRARQISYTKNQTLGKEVLDERAGFNLDSMLQAYGESKYMGREDKADHFQVVHPNGSIIKTDFFFDVINQHLQKIIYRYASDQVVTIRFDVWESNPDFTTLVFSEQAFVQITDEEVMAVGRCSGYRVIPIDQNENSTP